MLIATAIGCIITLAVAVRIGQNGPSGDSFKRAFAMLRKGITFPIRFAWWAPQLFAGIMAGTAGPGTYAPRHLKGVLAR